MKRLQEQGRASESILRTFNRYHFRFDYIFYRSADCLLSYHTTGYKEESAGKERKGTVDKRTEPER